MARSAWRAWARSQAWAGPVSLRWCQLRITAYPLGDGGHQVAAGGQVERGGGGGQRGDHPAAQPAARLDEAESPRYPGAIAIPLER
jgi:hypothetical protein